jgi:hypothetical protein
MIDLEAALAPLVERAPAPPAVESVVRRGRRHRRRRAVELVAALVLVAVAAVGAIAAVADRDEPRVLTPPADVEHLRVTLLDGSQLDISGPSSLDLTELPLSFNAQLYLPRYRGKSPAPGHSFSVSRAEPSEDRPVDGRYPTADGHELVVYRTVEGVDAVVRYEGWALVVNWNDDPAVWRAFANALGAHEAADGFLVVEPMQPGWAVGPTDAPDVQLGDEYGFYPLTYPDGCPAPDPRWRCDDGSRVRIGALDPSLADTLDDIDVTYTPAAPTP